MWYGAGVARQDIDITDDQPTPRKDAPLFGPGLPGVLGYVLAALIIGGLVLWLGKVSAAFALAPLISVYALVLCVIRFRTGSWP